MKSIIAGAALVVAATFVVSPSANAANVTPGVIFGSGNANGGFTVATGEGVEIGLRAKQRFPAAEIYNYDGVKTYNFPAGEGATDRSIWNFEWSINTDYLVSTGRKLDDLEYILTLDFDPGAGVSGLAFDPINGALYFDHALGDNTTTQTAPEPIGDGNKAADAGEYAIDIATLNVAQNSWAYSFFSSTAQFSPLTPGIYTIELEAFLNGDGIAKSSIDVVVGAVPVPAALPLFLSGLLGLGIMARRRRKALA